MTITIVNCGNAQHHIVIHNGGITLCDHSDPRPEEDMAMWGLGGPEPPLCVQILNWWRHPPTKDSGSWFLLDSIPGLPSDIFYWRLWTTQYRGGRYKHIRKCLRTAIAATSWPKELKRRANIESAGSGLANFYVPSTPRYRAPQILIGLDNWYRTVWMPQFAVVEGCLVLAAEEVADTDKVVRLKAVRKCRDRQYRLMQCNALVEDGTKPSLRWEYAVNVAWHMESAGF